MKKFLLFCFFSFSLLAACDKESGSLRADAKNYLPGQYFSLSIRQSGQQIAIADHTVRLAKAPFDIIFKMAPETAFLVNFSTNSRLYDGLKKGLTLKEILEDPNQFMGMAEEPFNQDEAIILDDLLPHYLYYGADDYHRFDKVEWEGDKIIATRHIARTTSPGLSSEGIFTSIKEYPYQNLYLSFYLSEWDADYKRVELERQWLKIEFE